MAAELGCAACCRTDLLKKRRVASRSAKTLFRDRKPSGPAQLAGPPLAGKTRASRRLWQSTNWQSQALTHRVMSVGAVTSSSSVDYSELLGPALVGSLLLIAARTAYHRLNAWIGERKFYDQGPVQRLNADIPPAVLRSLVDLINDEWPRLGDRYLRFSAPLRQSATLILTHKRCVIGHVSFDEATTDVVHALPSTSADELVRRVCVVNGLIIAPRLRRRGWGRVLMASAEVEAAHAGFSDMCISTLGVANVLFYQSCGFCSFCGLSSQFHSHIRMAATSQSDADAVNRSNEHEGGEVVWMTKPLLPAAR